MPKKPKGSKIKKKLNAVNLQANRVELEKSLNKQWIIKAIELLKEGSSNSYVRELIEREKQGSKSSSAINTILSEANRLITEAQFSKIEEIIPIHTKRYNNEINRLIETTDFTEDDVLSGITDWEGFYKAREKKIKAFNDCVNTLVQKERLLQFHNKDFVIEYNVEHTIKEVEKKQPKVNLKNLSHDERVMILKMIMKMKESENDILAITVTETVDKQVTVDGEAEVIEKPNIDEIKIEERPIPIEKSQVTIHDPVKRLKEHLKIKAAEQFKQAGGTLTDDEEKLII